LKHCQKQSVVNKTLSGKMQKQMRCFLAVQMRAFVVDSLVVFLRLHTSGTAWSMTDNFILKVQVLEGKGFGDDVQALLCSAGFAGETKQTQYSVNSNTHIWNSTLYMEHPQG